MHSNNTNMFWAAFIEFSRFYPAVKALYFKSAVILKILIVLKAVQINYQRTKRIKKLTYFAISEPK